MEDRSRFPDIKRLEKECGRFMAKHPPTNINLRGVDLAPLFAHHALYGNLSEMAKILTFDYKLDINWKASLSGFGPLHAAAYRGHLDVIKILLKFGEELDVNQRGKEAGETPFFLACDWGRTEVVKELLAVPKVDPETPNSKGVTPMEAAAANDHREIVQLLVDSGKIKVIPEVVKKCRARWSQQASRKRKREKTDEEKGK